MRRRSVKNRNRKRNRRRLIRCEALEDRRLLAAVPISELETNDSTIDRNDFVRDAQVITLGAPVVPVEDEDGQAEANVNISGTFDAAGTPDYYQFDLSAGDVFSARLTVSTVDATGDFDVSLGKLNPNGITSTELRGANSLGGDSLGTELLSPTDSPILTGGTLYFNYVIPETGTYTFRLGPGFRDFDTTTGFPTGGYNLELQTLRSPLERAEVGAHQTLFLDFDGGFVDVSEVGISSGGVTGTIRMPSLVDSLEQLGFQVTNENRLIDVVVAEMKENFADIAASGINGDFDSTGNPGDFKIEILNSRDHPDPWGLPNVSRIMMSGTDGDIGIDGALGIAPTIDIGNFDTEETTFVFIEDFLTETNAGNVFGIPHSISVSTLDVLGKFVGLVSAHEAGHFFGLRHTDNANSADQIIDSGGNIGGLLGVGLDGILGTVDDLDTDFGTDIFTPNEPDTIGRQDSLATLAFALPTGTAGQQGISGRVFSDANADGRGTSDPGIPGVTVFGDLNSNGQIDPGEPRTITDGAGNYALAAMTGTVQIVALTPSGFTPTTPTSVPTSATNGQSGPSFGFRQTVTSITGTTFVDTDGNGIRGTGEFGLGGVYIYADTDGDNRIDLFEPQGITRPDGTYNINFPVAGNYTLRAVPPPGFRLTFPQGGEHQVFYDGTSVNGNFDFGMQPARDFGDLPAPYPTLLSQDGASHGFSAGLGLGALTDIEADGRPTAEADGDDTVGEFGNAGPDDEDGVTLLGQLAPGTSTQLQVTTRNDGQSGFLQGWVDLNSNGSFADAGEQFFRNVPLTAGTHTLSTPVISAATVQGNKFARFRYGPELDLGPAGFSAAGEVEDYVFTVSSTADLAQDDSFADTTHPAQQDFTVPRDTQNAVLRVLANDAMFDPSIRIVSVDPIGAATTGSFIIPPDGQTILYTPRAGFIGQDVFTYRVTTDSGQVSTATVTVNVTFPTNIVRAVDDLFDLPEGIQNVTLDVLDNDVPTALGGLQIIGVGMTSNQGSVTITGNGQTLQYTPAPGFAGTEQFTYTVRDASGGTSTATVTTQLQPGASLDDDVEYTVQILNTDNQPIEEGINVGDLFKVRISVDDILNTGLTQGIGSAYVDLLYNDARVAVVPPADTTSGFPFDITFGSLFNELNTGDASTPGLIDDAGGSQSGLTLITHPGPVELFTITLRAVGAGEATFQTDPADNTFSDVVLITNTDQEVPVERQRFGSGSINIFPAGLPIPTAVDDVFRVPAGSIENAFPVLDNDIESAAGPSMIAQVDQPSNGFVRVVGNEILYTPQATFQGVDQFDYIIVSPDGFRSTGTVTVFVGNTEDNDVVDLPFGLVDASGLPLVDATGSQLRSVGVGEKVTLLVDVDDLRPQTLQNPDIGVFAAYLDVLYNANIFRVDPPSVGQNNSLNFAVEFGPFYTNSRVGNANTLGVIDEAGAVQITNTDGSGQPLGTEVRDLMAITFTAVGTGTATFAGDPADISPFQDTLLFQPSEVVPIDRIRYDTISITVGGGTPPAGEAEFQNPTNRYDVNNDGDVSPIDALSIINRLNTGGPASLTSGGAEGEASAITRRYVDVNGDNFLSPMDVLQVINELNRRVSAGFNGEFYATSSNQDSSDEVLVDTVIADLSTDAAPVTALPKAAATAAAVQWSNPLETEDDDEDAIDQIASDISQQWRVR